MNAAWLENIDKYLHNEMSDEEQLQFELELANDAELASVFNVYRTVETETRNDEKYKSNELALKGSIKKLNEVYFKTQVKQPGKIIQMKKRKLYKMIGAIAASIIVIVCCYFLFFTDKQNGQQLAKNYINSELIQISPKMDGAADNLQKGIDAYNSKDYTTALALFKQVANSQPQNSQAKKYTGLVYLVTNKYDKALETFDELAAMQGLYSNPGMFLKAVTLLKRDNEGDKEKAKQLLQQVVNENAEGSNEASQWLEKM